MDTDVVVIGAGLAGLQCARRVERSGLRAIVLEASDGVGGRIRTDVVDGFQVDRGFQVLNPAYPALRHGIDVAALDLQSFGVGVVVRDGADSTTLAHPLRHPRYLLSTLFGRHTSIGDLVGVARWIGPTMLRGGAPAMPGRDETLSASLDHAGLTGRLRRDVLDTFLAGVLSDSRGGASAHYARQLVRYFALGAPGLPRAGMQALPEQLAATLSEPVRLATPARRVDEVPGGVAIETDSGAVTGRIAVVAAGPQDVGSLTALPEPATHGLTTWWFHAPQVPRPGRFLMIDASRPGGGPAGPIWNTSVISNVAPSYAPAGRHLVHATTLLDRPDGHATENEVRRDLERLYETSTGEWEVLAHHVVPHTLPAQPPPLRPGRVTWAGDRTLIAGDHRESGSIQGALLSGVRAGHTVARRLTGRRAVPATGAEQPGRRS
jgi:phytoene dehydrogenase-like protein